MKKTFLQTLMLFTVMLFTSITASAYDFYADGIYYNITSPENKTVEVTEADNRYSGDIVIPSEVTYNEEKYSVTSVGGLAFYNCIGLTSVTIPSSVESIGYSAFSYCRGLTSLTIPSSVTSIGDYAFFHCSGLTSLTIPSSVESIGNKAFYNCSGLTSLTIQSGVTSIGSSAFEGCSGLTSVTIPSSVESIEYSVFYGCSGLTSVTIPSSVTSIEDYAFSDCSGLTSVTIPSSVTSIGNWAFSNCSMLSGTLTLPETITSIGIDAFKSTNYEICKIEAKTPPTIDGSSLPSGLSKVIVPNGCCDAYKANVNWSKYTIIAGGACDVEVTNETAGQLANMIQAQMGKNLNDVTNLTVHGTLNVEDLEQINSNMTSLLYLDLTDTDITELPAGIFQDKKILFGVKFPKNLKTIGESAFSGCENLIDKLEFPETLETIGNSAFYGCTSLPTIDLSQCVDLKQIPKYSFCNCKLLKTINMPSSLTSIENGAFAGCTGLLQMSVPCAVPPTIANDAFTYDMITNTCVLSLPTENKLDYSSDNYWKAFVEEKSKSEIQVSVNGQLPGSDACYIYFEKAQIQEEDKSTSVASLSSSKTEKQNLGITANGQSLFVGNGDAITFYIVPEIGYLIEYVLYNGNDVTNELVNNSYTTTAVGAEAVSKLEVKMIDEISVAIEEVNIDEEDGPIEYYNLQGVKVGNPSNGIFIKKQGRKTQKVIIK